MDRSGGDQALDASSPMRGVAARVGITALNIVNPGLGLVRLGRFRSGLTMLAAPVVLVVMLALYYQLGRLLTANVFLAVIVILIGVIGALYVAAMVLTWRTSPVRLPRAGWLWRWYGLIALHVLAVLATLPFVALARANYHQYFSPSESMLLTIELGDKFVARMRGIDPLQRGDTVIIGVGAVDYVKRIAGLPGDRIAMRAGQILLNGQPVTQRRVGTRRIEADAGEPSFDAAVLEERFPDEARPHHILDFGPRPQDYWPGATLGPDSYAVLGDSRDNTLDSRFPLGEGGGTGLVSRDRILGRVLFGYWRRGNGFGGFAL